MCVKALQTHHKITTHKEKTDGWLYREKRFCWPLGRESWERRLQFLPTEEPLAVPEEAYHPTANRLAVRGVEVFAGLAQ